MVKNLPANAGDAGSIPVSEDPLREEIAKCSSILAWSVHGQRSLASYSPWGHKESDMTEHADTRTYKLYTHTKRVP